MFYKFSIKMCVLCLLFLSVSALGSSSAPTKFDFDGDGKADIAVFRPSNGVWYILGSQKGFSAVQFGQFGDMIVPGDYDGDGKTDPAVYRNGFTEFGVVADSVWYILKSSDNTASGVVWGRSDGFSGNRPVPADFDGDRKTDLAILGLNDIANAPGVYRILQNPTGAAISKQWGYAYDKPALADYDGDGRDDLAVFRASVILGNISGTGAGVWLIQQSSNGQTRSVKFGLPTDLVVPADYDGDGKADISVYRPSNGTWYRINSNNGSFYAEQFGALEDKPVPADYDADGKADIAVFRPSNGTWYIQQASSGFKGQQFGTKEDVPVPNFAVR
ncbi:MAG: VCBS repeat-containing protein [Acidobacteria bacterium]|nr:VCBS repeat-containing protein [Acidobacteriota bacterium]MCA1639617.1 VCBS repeat-containing protein [Acidobacteriota bacterium]